MKPWWLDAWSESMKQNWTQRKADNGFNSTEHVLTLLNGDEIVLMRNEGRGWVSIHAKFPRRLSDVFHTTAESSYIGSTIRDAKKRVEIYVDYMRGI